MVAPNRGTSNSDFITMPYLKKFLLSDRYWSEVGCNTRPVYHNCLVWCYEHLSPDEELQRAITEFDPIDYLSIGRKSITYPTVVAFFTFACKSLRRFEDSPVSTYSVTRLVRGEIDNYLILFSLTIFPTIFRAILIVTSSPSLITGSFIMPISCAF